jgi:hypothetical protein
MMVIGFSGFQSIADAAPVAAPRARPAPRNSPVRVLMLMRIVLLLKFGTGLLHLSKGK